MDRNPYLHPIVHQIDALEARQKERVRKIAFWTLMAYLELWVVGGAATALVIAVLLVGFGIALLATRRIVPHAHVVVLHAGIVAGLITSLAGEWSWITVGDALLVMILGTLLIRCEHAAIPLLLALTHIAALRWSPASAVNQAAFSPAIAGLVFARLLALALVLIVATRIFRTSRSPEPPVAAEPDVPRRRPLTAAEWDAEGREGSIV